ncbi:hypothetical protein BDR04DRAFT_709920 [Suillus decipiens]|nr:hypothetical protein BDR04DRAFT_709920 [Suillus decipiens]
MTPGHVSFAYQVRYCAACIVAGELLLPLLCLSWLQSEMLHVMLEPGSPVDLAYGGFYRIVLWRRRGYHEGSFQVPCCTDSEGFRVQNVQQITNYYLRCDRIICSNSDAIVLNEIIISQEGVLMPA